MAINPLSASVPAAPIVDANGNVTTVWRGFFLAMQARTGGAPGVSVGTVNNDLSAEMVARTAGDAALNAAISAETAARTLADAVEAANRIAADAIFAESRTDTTLGLAAETANRIAADTSEATSRQTADAHARGFAFFMGAA
jgi:hypothetical protein